MKKVVSIILVLITVVCLASCDFEKQIRGELLTDESSNLQSSDQEFTLGDVDGSVYENKFIGIGCKLDSEWEFYTDEQINELNNVAHELVGDDLIDVLKDANVVYDTFANRNNGIDNININLEKVDSAHLLALDLRENYKALAPTMVSMLEQAGCTNITYELSTTQIGGKEFDCLNVVSGAYGVKMYQRSIAIKCNGYLANISITTTGADLIDEVLKNFYLID